MTKRIIIFYLILSVLCCFFGCNYQSENEEESLVVTNTEENPEPNQIEQNASDYIVRTDWMMFCFSKKDFSDSDIVNIASEAISVMSDIRNFLNVNYTLEKSKGTVCYFDSTYRSDDGQKRSRCFWDEKTMYCISTDDFVHEYVHMVCGNNEDLVYSPDKLFIEGLAQYVCLNFYDSIASTKYVFFNEASVSKSSSATEHKMICELLSDNGFAYNAKNYSKALVAIIDKYYGISVIDKNSDFYQYNIGYIFVDYCINQLGGMDKFLSVYCDSVTSIDVYGKSTDDIVIESCSYNKSLFNKK